MSKKLTALLTTAVVSGLIASQSAKAEDQNPMNGKDSMSDGKSKCGGEAKEGDTTKESEAKGKVPKKKNGDDKKNKCKGGCSGKAEDKK